MGNNNYELWTATPIRGVTGRGKTAAGRYTGIGSMGPQPSASPLFYTCNFPGCPSPVRVSISLIASLGEVVGQTDGDLQGVLYGKVTAEGTEVRDCRPVAGFGPEAMARAAKSEREVVGYYRVRHAEAMRLDDTEAAVADAYFARPGAVVLLIQRREGDAQANFFFRENGALVNLSLLMFPLNVGLLEQRREAPPHAIEEPVPVSPLRRTVAIVAAAALALGVGGGMLWTRAREARVVETAAAPSLPLRAERQGEDLKIVWDLNAAPVASAVSGVLDIDDGGVKRRIALDAKQVHFGSVLYAPTAQEIAIDFTAVQADGTASQASVLAILTKSTPGSPAPPIRNVAVNRTADRAVAFKAPAPVTRTFVPPAQRAAATPAAPDVESLPTAQLAAQPVEGLSLPPVKAPAPPAPVAAEPPPPSPAPAPRRAPVEPYVGPQLLFQAGARTPPELRAMQNRTVTVSVLASIDKTGKVLHAEAAPQQKVLHVAYVIAATEAALRCRFRPARRGDTPVASEAILTFRF
jgi:periplasmic protein TonB